MSLRKKIEVTDKESVITKGAPVAKDVSSEEKNNWTAMSLRMPESLKKEIKLNLKKRIGLSINSWILESILEKLQKESN